MKPLVQRLLRAFVVALLLPALLVPSGWAWRWCFCAAMRAADVETEASCCRELSKPSCCEGAEHPAEGGHHECGACRSYSPDNHVTPPNLPSLPAPALLACAVLTWPIPNDVGSVSSPATNAVRGPAPPGIGSLLPLRI